MGMGVEIISSGGTAKVLAEAPTMEDALDECQRLYAENQVLRAQYGSRKALDTSVLKHALQERWRRRQRGTWPAAFGG